MTKLAVLGICALAGVAIAIAVVRGNKHSDLPLFPLDAAPAQAASCLVTVTFTNDATQAEIDGVGARLDRDPHVASSEFRSKEAELERMRKRYPKLVEGIKTNPIPDSFVVVLKQGDDDRALARALAGRPGVYRVGSCPTRRTLPVTETTEYPPCRGLAKPITVATVQRTLRAGGFTMDRVHIQGSCKGMTRVQDTMGALSNEGSGSDDRTETEGDVTCSVTRGPIYPERVRKNLHQPPASPIFVGRKAAWWFKNVECNMYAGERHPDAQVAKLDAAMERLADTTRS